MIDDATVEKMYGDITGFSTKTGHGSDIAIVDFAKACYAAGQDAQRERIILLLHGIDRDQCEASDGWWETSYGAEFGADILAKIRANKEP